MKTLFALLFLVVSVALAVEGPSESPSAATEVAQSRDQYGYREPTTCCFDFTKRPIPLKLLKSFEYTSGRCSMAAVVFHTKRGAMICTNPSDQWVQDRIRDLS